MGTELDGVVVAWVGNQAYKGGGGSVHLWQYLFGLAHSGQSLFSVTLSRIQHVQSDFQVALVAPGFPKNL